MDADLYIATLMKPPKQTTTTRKQQDTQNQKHTKKKTIAWNGETSMPLTIMRSSEKWKHAKFFSGDLRVEMKGNKAII